MVFTPEIETLLTAKLPSAPRIVIERSLRRDIDDVLRELFPGVRFAVIDDENTSSAYGDHAARALKATHITLHLPKADDTHGGYIREKTKRADVLIAVGSGTINDLCKYAAHADGKPYVVIPTAASMNGYASANASITVEGYKKTVPARMPKAILCDVELITSAPARLTKSGLGDSLARPTAQADWLLSHLLLNTKCDETPFQLIAPFEPELFSHARGIAKGDVATIELLLKILLLSGLGMSIAGGSYPASQGEHMIAHTYGMLKHNTPRGYMLHGEEIGVTTLTMAAMQEKLLQKPLNLADISFNERHIAGLFGEYSMNEAKKAYAVKQVLIREAQDSPLRWHEIQEKIASIHIPPQGIITILEAAEAPLSIEALGWNANDYQTAITQARFMRERFTFLDLA